jgi:hypothetical protein
MAKSVKFNNFIEIKEIYKNDEESGNDTDYEEENINPIEILKNLLKKKSFGIEEFGQDYESNVELRRKVEISFNNIKNNNNIDTYIPYFNQELKNDPFLKEELNDIPKILGKEKEKDLQPCPKCSELMQINYNNCQICSRETVDIRCLYCCPNILELCSEKCKSIYSGEISLIEITNNNDQPIIMIEDDNQNMVLSVINHKLFYEELNQKDMLMINKPCPNCNDELIQNNEINEFSVDNKDNDTDNDNDNDNVKRIGVIPVKCCNCQDNYSYLVVCGICYQKSGIKYLCDDCEY